MIYVILDDHPPVGEPPPRLLMSEFAPRMLDPDRQGSPLWLANTIALLLRHSRRRPALALLDELPGAIRGCGEAIYVEGREMGRRTGQRAAEKTVAPSEHSDAPGAPGDAPEDSTVTVVELARHIARLGADRVAEVLGVQLVDLTPMLEGRVEPPKAGMRRLARELEG